MIGPDSVKLVIVGPAANAERAEAERKAIKIEKKVKINFDIASSHFILAGDLTGVNKKKRKTYIGRCSREVTLFNISEQLTKNGEVDGVVQIWMQR